MKAEHIVALGVRLFAIVVVLYAVREGVESVTYYRSFEDTLLPYLYLGEMLFMLLLAVLLWRFPLTISQNLLNFRQDDADGCAPITASQLQVVGFTLLGIYLCGRVLSDIVYWFIVWFVNQRNHTPIHLTEGQTADLVSTAFELLFALFLLFGAHRLDALLRKR